MLPKQMFLLLVCTGMACAYDIELELEHFQGVGQAVIPRSNASNGKVVHMLHDHIVRYEMCVHLPLEISIKDIVYSNSVSAGSVGDEVTVYLDDKKMGTFRTDDPAATIYSEWNDFKSSGPIGGTYFLDYGRHLLTIWATEADSFGLELDVINLDVGNATISNPHLECKTYCFNDLNVNSNFAPFALGDTAKPFSLQKYVKATVCAEEENVKVGFYHDGATYFQVRATRPLYETCSNNRDTDFRGCKLASPAWEFQNVPLEMADDSTIVRNTTRAKLTVDTASKGTLKRVVVSFDMSGFSITRGQGERQTSGSLFVHVDDLPPNEEVTMKISYIGKSGRLDHGDTFKFTNVEPFHFWQLQDDYWGNNDANLINLEITTNSYSFRDIKIKDIKLEKKDMQIRQFKIADDGQFVFEGIYREPWWLKQTAMKVEVVDDYVTKTDFHDIANLRVYMKKPYEDGYSQIFVIHDDGHSRLQPVAAHGIDWTPFGTSFILGPNDPSDVRPYASIRSISIKPSKLRMTITYQNGSVVTLRLIANPKETTLRIVDYKTPADTSQNALITVLSTWIDNGYSFVDHMAVDGVEEPIMDNLSDDLKKGRRVVFYRKCLSRLNTQSPDIDISAPLLTTDDA